MEPRYQPDQLHIFEIEGKRFLYDVNSAKFFKIDPLTEEILGLWNSRAEGEIKPILGGRHQEEEIERALEEIKVLINLGLLFSEERPLPSPPQPDEPRIATLTLNVVAGCNLRCRYCWNYGGRYGQESGALMTEEIARGAVDLAVRHSLEGDEILVDFYGGEPLLNFEVIRRTIDYGTQLQEKANRRVTYKITTNGTLLSDEIVDYLSDKEVYLGVSIDGPREIHDFNRPFPSGRGSWEVIYPKVKDILNSEQVQLSARATLAPPHLDMVGAATFLYDMGFADVEVEFADEPSGVFGKDSDFSITDADRTKAREEYLKFAHSYLDELLERNRASDVGLSNRITRVLYETPKLLPCGAGQNILAVSPAGELYPCLGFVDMEGYQLGGVESGLEMESLSGFRNQLVGMMERCSQCAHCWARHLCAGNCPANNVQYNNDIHQPYEKGCEDLKFQMEVAMWLASEIQDRSPKVLEEFRPA